MSEDAKSKLKEKMGATVSEEDLDKVAGGTSDENRELITALYKIDPQGVSALMSSLKPGNEHDQIASGIGDLLQKNLGLGSGISTSRPNYYGSFFDNGTFDEKSHAEVLEMIDQKARELGR